MLLDVVIGGGGFSWQRCIVYLLNVVCSLGYLDGLFVFDFVIACCTLVFACSFLFAYLFDRLFVRSFA